METECPSVYQELTNMQLKIASLFKDLLKETANHKQNYENLSENLERLSTEAEHIRKENRALREINDEMKNVICQGVRVLRSLDLSSLNIRKEHEVELENLKKHFVETYQKLGNEADASGKANMKFSSEEEKPLEQTVKSFGCTLTEEEIKKELDLIKDLNFTTQFFQDDDTSSNNKEVVLNESSCDSPLKSLFKRRPENVCEEVMKRHPLLVRETETFESEKVNTKSSKVVETSKVEFLNRSPVFKDFGVRKHESLPIDENDMTSRLSPVNVDSEKLVEKSKSLIISPWKKPNFVTGSSPIKGPSTPKRVRKKLKITSPKQSPKAQLKMSNSKEVEISCSGVRKLTQTLLNIECYRRSPENRKNCDKKENEDLGSLNETIKLEAKKITDPEDDDFIIESPKKSENLLEDIKNRNRNGNGLNDIQIITPPESSDADLDETYVSASLVRRCELTKKHVLERIIEDQTPLKRPARETSPEYDSVPFAYRRDPVRKKAERMKLPGHACVECNKYYENALGDVDTQHLKKVLNKCSRHRDKNSPTHDETPPVSGMRTQSSRSSLRIQNPASRKSKRMSKASSTL